MKVLVIIIVCFLAAVTLFREAAPKTGEGPDQVLAGIVMVP
ncbi:MAG: hypothetical protein M0001_11640 [Treponema sp.]|nr:hypothetical protein [Treponema sp.]